MSDSVSKVKPQEDEEGGKRSKTKRNKFVCLEDLIKVYGNRQFHHANYEARRVVDKDCAVTEEGEPVNFKAIDGVEKAYNYVTQRYVEYVLLLKLMDSVMDSLLHPQKRILFKKFIEAIAGRVCELRREMSKLGCRNVPNLVGYLQDVGLTPDDLQCRVPLSLRQNQKQALESREEILSMFMKSMGGKKSSALDVCSKAENDDIIGELTGPQSVNNGRRNSSIQTAFSTRRDSNLFNISTTTKRDNISVYTSPSQAHRDSAATTMSFSSVRDSRDLGNARDNRGNAPYNSEGAGRRNSAMFDTFEKKSLKTKDTLEVNATSVSKTSIFSSTSGAGTTGKKRTSGQSTASAKNVKKQPDNPELHDFVNSRRYREWLANPKFHEQVLLLQKQIKCYLNRSQRWKTRNDYHTFIDMNKGPKVDDSAAKEEESAAFQEKLETREREYRSTLKSLRRQFLPSSEGDFDKWALALNVNQWVLELRDVIGKFQPYPDVETGGCGVLFSHKTVAEVTEELEDMEENEKQKKKSGKDEKKKKNDKGKEKTKGKNKDEGYQWIMPRSATLPGLVRALQEYGSYWELKQEESNLEQRFDLQLAKEKVREEAEETIRQLVDSMMREEMERLRAIDKELPPRPEKKKEKKEKGKKGKKDPLDGKSVEELYEELIMARIAIKPRQVSMDDIIGAVSTKDDERTVLHVPSVPEVRMALREMFALPLCSSTIHSNMELCNSVLLAGPRGVGKTKLAHGLVQETGANLLDLSPVNMAGKYQGKKEETYLMNVLLKVSKSMEPTIILVDECHLLFRTKKAPKRPDVDSDKPARLAKLLSKLMKKLKPGDRTVLIGLTSEPFIAKTGPLCKLFQEVLILPHPEYGTREALWNHFLGRISLRRPHTINSSVMAKLTEGYTGGDIVRIINQTFPSERRRRKKPLNHEELIPALVTSHPDDETPKRDKWIEWYLSTPVMKARAELIKSIIDEEEAAAAAKSKKK